MKTDNEWRQKYQDAIQQLESGEAQWKQTEGALRTLTNRLCLAALGRHDALDEQVRRVSDKVRAKADASELQSLVEPLSRAIELLDQGTGGTASSSPAPGPVARASQTAPANESQIEQAPSAGTGISRASGGPQRSHESSELAPTDTAGAGDASPMRNEGSDTRPVGANSDKAREGETTTIRARLSAAVAATLERLSVLPDLRPALDRLQEKPPSQVSADDLAATLQKLTGLIGEQRTRLQAERLEVEGLLTTVNKRLEEIATHLASDLSQHQVARDSSHQLNSLVMGEVHEITTEVRRASDLGDLRAQVAGRLDAISQHFQDFRAREEARVRTQVDRTELMRARITELERESRVLQETLQHEQRTALMDALTGIPNRAAYDERIAQEFADWQRTNAPMSLLAWDIDRFKGINDQYGHKAGDKVLRIVGQHLAQSVRGTDFVARYGGEEFVMILTETTLEQALLVAEKIRQGIAALGFHFRNVPVTVTASCGITACRPDDTIDGLFERADGALYRAKNEGRNRCVTD
jgi:diguanylate cyclase